MPELRSHLESEIKLAVPALFTLPALVPDRPGNAKKHADTAGVPVRAHRGAELLLRAAYQDTSDLRLARSGVTLRHRTGESEPLWTLKLPATTGLEGDRTEFNVPGPPDEVPAQLSGLVTGYVRTGALAEIAVLATRRQVWSLCDARAEEVAEVVDDLVSVVAQDEVAARFRELEIERRGIDEAWLASLVRRLEAAGAVRGAFVSKLARALGPQASAPPDVPVPGAVRRRDPASALLTYALRSSVSALLAQDVGVRLGNDDAVHKMRVACRRLRSDLRTFAPLIEPEPAARIRTELAWLADGLGAARDLEVLRSRLRRTFAADPLAPLDPSAFDRLDAILAERETAAHADARQVLGEERYVMLLEALVALAREPCTTALAAGAAKDVLPLLVAAAVADLDQKVGRLRRNSPDVKWHAARIHAKRARYAAEAAAAALGKEAAATGAALAGVQEVLGEHQDAAIAAQVLMTIAARHPEDPALVLLCGRLAERERYAVRSARVAAPGIWRAAAAPRLRRWLPMPEAR